MIDVSTILASSAIATVVATVINAVFQAFGAARERVARERLASDERLAREKLASDERIARERLAAEERSARRKELLLEKATEMARTHTDRIVRIADDQIKRGIPTTVTLKPDIVLAEEMYRWLAHLLDNGELPPEAYAKLHVPQETADGRLIAHGFRDPRLG